ncbi:MAG TPA: hypothetical protein VFY40_28430 [Blastocatellia bacterium]|nr:hypothetical protein [Blastocatellia bacterium]
MKLRFQIEQARFGKPLFQLCGLQFKLRRLRLSIPRFPIVAPCQPATRNQPVDQIIPLKRAAQGLFEIRESERHVARISRRQSAAGEKLPHRSLERFEI